MKSTTQKLMPAIHKMVRRIVDRFDPEQVYLFGSHGRGNARPDSDVDLMVVMPVGKNDKREKRIDIRVALHDIPVAKDVFVVTPEELVRYQDVPGTLIQPALREGKLIYDRNA
jgi:predicted nucleotidyltransferase